MIAMSIAKSKIETINKTIDTYRVYHSNPPHRGDVEGVVNLTIGRLSAITSTNLSVIPKSEAGTTTNDACCIAY